MENTPVLEKPDVENYLHKVKVDNKTFSTERSGINLSLESILYEGGEDFFQYVQLIGLSNAADLMVLSSMRHYYYNQEDLLEIKTLVNIKRLNHIEHLDSFLYTLFRILPEKANFIGCYKNINQNEKNTPSSHSSKFFKGLINTIESRTDRNLSKISVTRLLEKNGFKIIDNTEINGMTYFWSQNNRRQ